MKLNAEAVLLALAIPALLLALIHVALQVLVSDFNAGVTHGISGLFNLNNEVSIPTWYSQTLLFVAAGLFFVIGSTLGTHKKYWYGLSAVFVFLSIDEGAAIHELLSAPVGRTLEITSGPLYYGWFLVYGAVLVVFALLYLRFFLSLPRRLKAGLILAALVFLAGAIGFEAVGGSIAAESGEISTAYSMAVVAEELLEMLGVAILISVLIAYLASLNATAKMAFKR